MASDDVPLARARALMAIDSEDALALVGPDGGVHRLADDSAELARAVLSHCAEAPRTRAAIHAYVAERIGQPLEDTSVVDALVDLLRRAGALVPAKGTAPPRPSARSEARVLLCIGGAVASAHAPALVQALQARGYEVRVVATTNALRFVARETLEALTHRAVFTSIWQRDDGVRVPHIELAAWADLVLVWPATAAAIARIAAGDCSELLSAIAVTTRAPVLVAPSMNEGMYTSPSTQRNLETMRRDGFALVPPAFAREVAHAPDRRAPMLGGAPGPATLARLVPAALRLHEATHPRVPRSEADWDAAHRRVPEEEQAWFTGEVDPQIARALEAHTDPSASLWDVGTGHGATAAWAARRGHRVVATDLSALALDRARARFGEEVTWLRDDVTESALRSTFDVVVDRGTLHLLPPDRRAAYAQTLRARTRPGSIVVVKVHAPPSDPRVLSHPLASEELVALMRGFEAVAVEPGTFSGTIEPPPQAVMAVLRRV